MGPIPLESNPSSPHAARRAPRLSVTAAILLAIVALAPSREARADAKAQPKRPTAAPVVTDGDADAGEAEGPERIDDRLRWFHQGRLGPDGQMPPDARNRALKQLEDNIQAGTLRAQPVNALPGDGWSSIGPTPLILSGNSFSGRVTAIAVHPTNANIAYVGGAQGGVWKTTDHGATWTPLTDTQASLSVGAIAINPSNANVVYVGTGEANNSCDSYFGVGILKSTDGGTTWSVIGATPFANTSVSKIVVDPTNSSVLWAANTTGSGGYSCYGTSASVSVGLWKSTDGGVSWTRTLSAGHVHDIVIHPTASPRVLYAGVDHSGIWRSTDAGVNWTRLSSGLPVATVIGRVAIAIDPTTPTTLYAIFSDYNNATQYNGTYKSTNSGATWTLLMNSKPSGMCQYWSFQDLCTYTNGTVGQCWYDLVIGVAADGGVWEGGTGIWRSGDGGSTWNAVCPQSLHPDQHALVLKGTDVWLGNDGGVFTTANNGAAWTSRNPGLTLTQFYPGGTLDPTNAAVALGGAQDNGALWYGGAPGWTQLITGDGGFTAIDFTDPSVLYVSTQYLNIWKFSGGSLSNVISGLSDANNTSSTGFISPFAMCPNDAQTLIAGSNNIWRTSDGAASWSSNSPDPLDGLTGATMTTVAFAPSTGDCSTYFAGDTSGRVFVTANGGGSWNDITSALPSRAVNDIAVDPTNPASVYVALSGFGIHHLWHTSNALDSVPTWFFSDIGIPDVPANAILIDPTATNVLYLGTDLGIFRSTDSGANWSVFMGGHPNVAVFDLVANAATGTILSYTHGRGVFKLGTFCNDNNACTTDSYSQTLGCQHTALTCTASDQCHVAGTCDAGTGLCSNPSAPDGTGCNDGNACTQGDACQSGSCAGNPVICAPSDQCHLAGTCDGGTGLCSNPAAPDGTTCDDGSACTTADACANGSCAGTPGIAPGEVGSVIASKSDVTASFDWSATAGAIVYDMLRGRVGDWPVGSNPGTETCFDNVAGTNASDPAVPAAADGFWYLLRAENACGNGGYGSQAVNGVPTAPRVSATCP